MTISEMVKGNDGEPQLSTATMDREGPAGELIRLSRHLSNAAHCAERLASQFAKPVESAIPSPEPVEELKTAPSGSIEWGDPIAVDGERPEWLRATEPFQWRLEGTADFNEESDNESWFDKDRMWTLPTAIRLPASHPYYLATSRGFTYWPGGNSAPDDWDGGEVLWTDGPPCIPAASTSWKRESIPGVPNVIGYHPELEDATPAETVATIEEAVRDGLIPGLTVDMLDTPTEAAFTIKADSFRLVDTGPAPADPRAPLLAEVEKAAIALRGRNEHECGYLPELEEAAALIERLAAELIVQDKRMLQLTSAPQFFSVGGLVEQDLAERYQSLRESYDKVRTYDDEARVRAAIRLEEGRFGYMRENYLERVDVVAEALGLKRTCAADES
jgi:hypothetical protein